MTRRRTPPPARSLFTRPADLEDRRVTRGEKLLIAVAIVVFLFAVPLRAALQLWEQFH